MELRKFEIAGKEIEFVNQYRSTRSGFAHDTTLFIDGYRRAEATCHYLNRTWECYTYQTVMKEAVYELIAREKEIVKDTFKRAKGYQKLTKARQQELEEVYKTNEELKFLNAIYAKLNRY